MFGRDEKPAGCWTCRLRRKKCDGLRPVCKTCAALVITCHNGTDKPEWMDGAGKQQEAADSLKQQIKTGASGRRARQRMLDELGARDGQVAFIVTSQQDYAGDSSAQVISSQGRAQAPLGDHSSMSATQSMNPSLPEPLPIQPPPPSEFGKPLPDCAAMAHLYERVPDGTTPCGSLPSHAWETEFVMVYLDTVFPFIFPHYRPQIVDTGRSWLLLFLMEGGQLIESATSLSSYFLKLTLSRNHPGKYETCTFIAWNNVLKRTNSSFKAVRLELKGITRRVAQPSVLVTTRVIGRMLYMLMFENLLGISVDWESELMHATKLFEDLIDQHAHSSDPGHTLLHLMHGLSWTSEPLVRFGRHVWTPDQNAFRFFTASLLYLDIISSTSLGRIPRLHKYHPYVLSEATKHNPDVNIDLSSFFGCQNWALVAIADITALDVWKKENKKTGRLSVPDLVQRADRISASLNHNLDRLDASPTPSQFPDIDSVRSFYDHLESPKVSPIKISTRIWAYAARIYLSVVLSGYQPSNPQVRADVAQIIALLKSINSAGQLRCLAWPICIAGCLAEMSEQKQYIRSLIIGAGDSNILYALTEAGKIMEGVWNSRDLGSESWDLGACLRILGRPALLI